MAPTFTEQIAEVRAALICERCGRYVGSLAESRYRPAPYPVAVDRIGADDEALTLIAFERHMIGLLRSGNFVIRHPERDGRCISIREWLAGDEDEDEDDDGRASVD